jgi:hypothetical protein
MATLFVKFLNLTVQVIGIPEVRKLPIYCLLSTARKAVRAWSIRPEISRKSITGLERGRWIPTTNLSEELGSCVN